MKTTRLGTTGLTVSRICLGMMTYGSPQWRPWVLDEAASRPLVKHAVELGINFFVPARVLPARRGRHRDQAVLSGRERLGAMAAARGVSNATLAYAWLLHKGVTAPIVGASKLHQLDQAAAAAELALSAEEIASLEAGYEPHPVIGHA
ncbi:MAG TPA: aldo/keto reductase [Albitalea sp.]|nr:aldo/keto reductase [Albitalea sp.]